MFQGSYVAMVTPFNNGQIDEAALRKMVNHQIDSGTHGLVPMGTTGESSTVSEAEHKRVVEIVVQEAAGRIPVIVGAGSNNPIEALTYAQHAQDVGADGILCVAGYYNKPSQQGLFEHFRFIHDQTDIPMIIYNIPPRAVVDILPETMAKIAALPRVVGVKDATADLSRIAAERSLIDKPFSYLSGEDVTALAYNVMGGGGCISVTANVAPRLVAEMQNACLAGDYVVAREIHDRLVPLHDIMFANPNPAGPKYGASLLTLCQNELRLPMLKMEADAQAHMAQVLKNLDLLR